MYCKLVETKLYRLIIKNNLQQVLNCYYTEVFTVGEGIVI